MVKDTNWATSFEIKTLFLQEMFDNGIYSIGTHNLSHSHSNEDINTLIETYNILFEKIKFCKENKSIQSSLKSHVLRPLFQVR